MAEKRVRGGYKALSATNGSTAYERERQLGVSWLPSVIELDGI